MKTQIQYLTELVSKAFEDVGYDGSYGAVRVSDRPDLCDFQCNGAMSAAKAYKLNPRAVSEAVASRLKDNICFDEVSVAGPGFLNLKLSDSHIYDTMNKMAADSRHGFPLSETPAKIIIDYGGPNVAKPLHVGHLRSAIIGETLKRLSRFLGHETIGDVHLGDFGLQCGLVLTEMQERWPELPYFRDDYSDASEQPLPINASELYDIYPVASARSKTDEAFMEKAQKATYMLQKGHAGYNALWNKVVALSMGDLKKNYAELSVDFDLWLGESDAEKYVEPMVQDFIDKGFCYENEGALIIDVEKDGDTAPMPPILIKKSSGAVLYATTDLATIVQRIKDFKPTDGRDFKIWYVVDNRQALHFEQVFRCAYKTGIAAEDEVEFQFLGFGTMNGKDNKPFKTRDGGVMRLGDLIDMIHSAFIAKSSGAKAGSAAAESSDGAASLDPEAAADTAVLADASSSENARLVGNAALKFGDLVNHRSKNYIFDLDKFMSFEGKTGPYLLYSVVRINSLLKKAAGLCLEPSDIIAPAGDTERRLMLRIMDSGDTLFKAFEEKAPNYICEELFDIASIFNKFYYETKVLSETDAAQRGSWLTLLNLVKDIMTTELNILGIDIPDKM